jgi:uncharacterized membrane protein YhaH (DUF805 family)
LPDHVGCRWKAECPLGTVANNAILVNQVGMTITIQSFLGFLKKTLASTLRFTGRSRRTEVLVYWLAITAIGIVPFLLGPSFEEPTLLDSLMSLTLFIPFPALLARRLHDQNRSGWWALLLAPAVAMGIADQGQSMPGAIVLMVGLFNLLIVIFLLWPGSDGENKFGPNPRDEMSGS